MLCRFKYTTTGSFAVRKLSRSLSSASNPQRSEPELCGFSSAQRGHSSLCHSLAVVIIGGVAGGATAAARSEARDQGGSGRPAYRAPSRAVRRLTETAKITIIERGPDVSFANCGLPYYIGDGEFNVYRACTVDEGPCGSTVNACLPLSGRDY